MKNVEKHDSIALVPQELIENKIYLLRGHKVMFDKDLASLYGIETRYLNKSVNRNINRFPKDFMFMLTKDEYSDLKFQFGTSRWGGSRKLPRAFTEHGILMLSSVLRSRRAVAVNIAIMRTFIIAIFNAIRQIMKDEEQPKKKYGFETGGIEVLKKSL